METYSIWFYCIFFLWWITPSALTGQGRYTSGLVVNHEHAHELCLYLIIFTPWKNANYLTQSCYFSSNTADIFGCKRYRYFHGGEEYHWNIQWLCLKSCPNVGIWFQLISCIGKVQKCRKHLWTFSSDMIRKICVFTVICLLVRPLKQQQRWRRHSRFTIFGGQ